MSGFFMMTPPRSGLLAMQAEWDPSSEKGIRKQQRTGLLASAVVNMGEENEGLADYQGNNLADPANALFWRHDPARRAPRGGWGSWSFAIPVNSNYPVEIQKSADNSKNKYRKPSKNPQLPKPDLDVKHGKRNIQVWFDKDFEVLEEPEYMELNYGGRLPKGMDAIALATTGHGLSHKVLAPVGGPLVADWASDKSPEYSRHVFAMNGDELDHERHAGLHSMMKVVATPSSCDGTQKTGDYALALNCTGAPAEENGSKTGHGLAIFSGGGAVQNVSTHIEKHGDTVEASHKTSVKPSKSQQKQMQQQNLHAYMSYTMGGPWHPGDPDDKHQLGKSKDGKFNSGHISTQAYFFLDKTYDGPMEFIPDAYPDVSTGIFDMKVFCKMDFKKKHGHPCGSKDGVWAWYYQAMSFPYDPGSPPYLVIDPGWGDDTIPPWDYNPNPIKTPELIMQGDPIDRNRPRTGRPGAGTTVDQDPEGDPQEDGDGRIITHPNRGKPRGRPILDGNGGTIHPDDPNNPLNKYRDALKRDDDFFNDPIIGCFRNFPKFTDATRTAYAYNTSPDMRPPEGALEGQPEHLRHLAGYSDGMTMVGPGELASIPNGFAEGYDTSQLKSVSAYTFGVWGGSSFGIGYTSPTREGVASGQTLDLDVAASSAVWTPKDANGADLTAFNDGEGAHCIAAPIELKPIAAPTGTIPNGTMYTDTSDGLLYGKDASGTFALSAGGGTDLTGLGTDNMVARWNGTDTIQNSGVGIDDTDNVDGIVDLTTEGDVSYTNAGGFPAFVYTGATGLGQYFDATGQYNLGFISNFGGAGAFAAGVAGTFTTIISGSTSIKSTIAGSLGVGGALGGASQGDLVVGISGSARTLYDQSDAEQSWYNLSNVETMRMNAEQQTLYVNETTTPTTPATNQGGFFVRASGATTKPSFIRDDGSIVDLDSGTNYWERVGTVLSPGNDGSDGDTLQVGAGLSTAPGYAFEGDPNTGMYSVAADQIGFATGATARMVVSNSVISCSVPIELAETGTPATPSANFGRLYGKDAGGVTHPYWIDEAGTEYDLTVSGDAFPNWTTIGIGSNIQLACGDDLIILNNSSSTSGPSSVITLPNVTDGSQCCVTIKNLDTSGTGKAFSGNITIIGGNYTFLTSTTTSTFTTTVEAPIDLKTGGVGIGHNESIELCWIDGSWIRR